MGHIEEMGGLPVEALAVEGPGGSVGVEEMDRFVPAGGTQSAQGVDVFVKVNVQQVGVPIGQCAVFGVGIGGGERMTRLVGVEVVVLALEEVEVPRYEVHLGIPLGHRDEGFGRDGGIDIPIHRLDLRTVEVVLQPLLRVLESR